MDGIYIYISMQSSATYSVRYCNLHTHTPTLRYFRHSLSKQSDNSSSNKSDSIRNTQSSFCEYLTNTRKEKQQQQRRRRRRRKAAEIKRKRRAERKRKQVEREKKAKKQRNAQMKYEKENMFEIKNCPSMDPRQTDTEPQRLHSRIQIQLRIQLQIQIHRYTDARLQIQLYLWHACVTLCLCLCVSVSVCVGLVDYYRIFTAAADTKHVSNMLLYILFLSSRSTRGTTSTSTWTWTQHVDGDGFQMLALNFPMFFLAFHTLHTFPPCPALPVLLFKT